MSLQIAQAAVDDATIHFDKLYSYCIPPRLNDKVWPGSMVLVPFGRGNKPRMAVVLSVAELPEDADTQKLKTLYDAAPAEARLTPDLLELVRFLKDRTFCTWFEAVKAVIPYGAQYRAAVENGHPVMQNRLSRSTERLYTLAGKLPAKPKPGPRQLAAMEALSTGPKTARQLDEAGISKATLDALCKKGVLTVAEQDKSLDLFADIPFDPQPLTLSEEQQKAFATLLPDLEDDKPHAALLHGVTGSGKTVVFLKLIERTLELGRRALVLIFSDLFTDTAELKNALRHLHFRKHDVAVFHLVDQLEIDFDFDRPIRFVDMEGGGSLITEPDLIADEYRAIVASYLEETRRICTDINADYRLVGTGDSLEDVLTGFLMGRQKKKAAG